MKYYVTYKKDIRKVVEDIQAEPHFEDTIEEAKDAAAIDLKLDRVKEVYIYAVHEVKHGEKEYYNVWLAATVTRTKFIRHNEGLIKEEEEKHMGKRIDFLRALTQGKEQAICSYLLESFGTLPTREMMQELIRCVDDCEEHGLTMTAEQSRQVAAWQIEEGMA